MKARGFNPFSSPLSFHSHCVHCRVCVCSHVCMQSCVCVCVCVNGAAQAAKKSLHQTHTRTIQLVALWLLSPSPSLSPSRPTPLLYQAQAKFNPGWLCNIWIGRLPFPHFRVWKLLAPARFPPKTFTHTHTITHT